MIMGSWCRPQNYSKVYTTNTIRTMAYRHLEKITGDKISKLMTILKEKAPFSVPVYSWIRVHLEWEEKIPGVTLDLLCPGGDPSRGQVVGICRGLMTDDLVYMVVYAEPGDAAELTRALRASPLVSWPHVAIVTQVVGEPLISLTRDVLRDKITATPDENACNLYVMSAEEGAAVPDVTEKLPEGVSLIPLDERHLGFLESQWPHFSVCFRPVMLAMLRHNAGVGVVVRGELVSMCLEAEHGGMGMGQTEEAHRGRGLVLLAGAWVMRSLGERGHRLHFSVRRDNKSSLHLVEKKGAFRPSGPLTHFNYMQIIEHRAKI